VPKLQAYIVEPIAAVWHVASVSGTIENNIAKPSGLPARWTCIVDEARNWHDLTEVVFIAVLDGLMTSRRPVPFRPTAAESTVHATASNGLLDYASHVNPGALNTQMRDIYMAVPLDVSLGST
jgi:hypothetical protein